MSLKEYRRKRNFRGTPEPKGKAQKTKGALRFVIQKHDASRIHFDFRLEMGGVYKSWAVPKGPSLNPLDQRLAVFVEDHPIDYGAFEGVIPKGNYGAGTVMIWDRGTYEPRAKDGDEKTLLEGLAEGRLTFVLHGEKLNGEFALVRLKRSREQNAWLLMKKQDSEAVFRPYEPDDVSATTGRTMAKIAKAADAVWLPKKGPRPPLKKLVDKKPKKKIASRAPVSSPDAIPRRVRPMQPLLAKTAPAAGEWIYEPYVEGTRAIAEIDRGRVKIYSRSLTSLDVKYRSLVRALTKVKTNAVLDGEILADGTYLVSDVLYLKDTDLREKPLTERKKLLAAMVLPDGVKAVGYSTKPAGAGVVLAKRADSAYGTGVTRDWQRIGKAKQKAEAQGPDGQRPPLTNQSKIYWPEDKITKGDLVAYYEKVAPVILPYLVDRPESLHRQPDGIKTEGFFHKDQQGYLPRRIKRVPVYSESGNKTVHYLLCQDAWTLLYLANLGCIELNPWLSRTPHLDRPDYGVIDLDPDDNTFQEVIEVALEVRKVLRAIGADGWCKTSGATGIHIYVPVGAKYDYDRVRELILAVCEVVHARHPKNTSLERSPGKRRGRIYLDFLQNRRSQTIAAPYCVRPHRGAPVSTPLRWSEVKKGLKPSQFTIRSVPERIAVLGDVWSDMANTTYDVDVLLKKIAKLLPAKKR